MSQFNRDGPTKFERTFFQIAKLSFLMSLPIFDKIHKISENTQGPSLKARGLFFFDSSPSFTYLNKI